MYLDIEAAQFVRALSALLPSVSTDTTRPHLNAICFEVDFGTLRMISTDGHRLTRWEPEPAHYTLATSEPEPDADAKPDALARVPAEVVPEPAARTETLIARADAERFLALAKSAIKGSAKYTRDALRLTLRTEGASVTVACAGASYTAKCPDAAFPPWRQVVPAGSRAFFGADPGYLADACKALIAAGSGGIGVLLSGGDLDPIVLTGTGAAPEFFQVLMPMRVDVPADIAAACASTAQEIDALRKSHAAEIDAMERKASRRERALDDEIKALHKAVARDAIVAELRETQEALTALREHQGEYARFSMKAREDLATELREARETMGATIAAQIRTIAEFQAERSESERMLNEAQAAAMRLARKLDALAPAEVVPEPEPSAVRLSEPEPDAMALALATIAAAFGQGTAA